METVIPDIPAYRSGLALHRERRLAEARPHYRNALGVRGFRPATGAEISLVRRHAPRLFITPTEPLPLAHFAAILHPELPLIAYHLFWEDDIDFPDDDEPCDHEVIWVHYAREDHQGESRVENVFTYYHGHILSIDAATQEAGAHSGRPRVDVQWGKHGSLPFGWRRVRELVENMRRTYDRLSTGGARQSDHPVAAGWPNRFEGAWEDFVDFAVEVDLLPLLRESDRTAVGELANAIIAEHFLPINFAAKFSWPDLERRDRGIY